MNGREKSGGMVVGRVGRKPVQLDSKTHSRLMGIASELKAPNACTAVATLIAFYEKMGGIN